MIVLKRLTLACVFALVSCPQNATAASPTRPSATRVAPVASDAPSQPWLGLGFTWHKGLAGEGSFVRVQKVSANGPAAKAGVLPGDIILSIDGTPAAFSDQFELILFLNDYKAGETIKVRVVRGGVEKTLSVVLGVMPPEVRARWEEGLERARRERLSHQSLTPK